MDMDQSSSGQKRWRAESGGSRGGRGGSGGSGSKRGRGGSNSNSSGNGTSGSWVYPPSKDGNYTSAQMSNKDFDEYYKAQGIIPVDEWEQFMMTMRKALPVTFRINPLAHNAAEIRRRLLGDEETTTNTLIKNDSTSLQLSGNSLTSSSLHSVPLSSSVVPSHSTSSESDKNTSTFLDNIDVSNISQSTIIKESSLVNFNSSAPSGPSKAASVMSLFSTPIQMDDGSIIAPPQVLSWKNDAYQLSYGKGDLRKNAKLKSFHEWLQLVSDEGSITRQEAVSMIPPLLLDVQPHHIVLDMCAAPGSKTGQLIEMLHLGELSAKGSSGSATGLVVANDSDTKRAYLLCSQCNRLGSPALVVTCHDAQLFPNLNKSSSSTQYNSSVTIEDKVHEDILDKKDFSTMSTVTTSVEGVRQRGERTSGRIKGQGVPGCFDRVLCDVPCSGDGTARKNADMFIRWSPSGALALHPLQIQICMRGLALVKVGGLLVYSTCSLNPIEDEAVVCEVLRRCEGSVELLDPSKIVPGLKVSPGVSTWKVFDKDMQLFSSWDELQVPNAHGHPHKNLRKMNKSNFPPSPEIATTYNLHYCMRLLPHHQDTGGFFVALFRKVAPLSTAKPWYAPNSEVVTSGGGTVVDAVDTEDELESSRAKPFYGRVGPSSLPVSNTSQPLPSQSFHTNDQSATSNSASIDVDSEVVDTEHVDESVEDKNFDNDNNNEDAMVDEGTLKSAPLMRVPPPTASSTSSTLVVSKTSWMPPKTNLPTTVPSGKGIMNDCDSKGRKLSGRFELSTYEKCDVNVVSDLIKDFGLGRDYMQFPASQLFTRSETSKNIVIVSELVSQLVIPQQKLGTGEGRVKTVNTGLKAFAENKSSDKYKKPQTMSDTTESSDKSTIGGGSLVTKIKFPPFYVQPTDYRLLQEGLPFVLPFMSRQIVYASGKEAAHVLKYRGQFVAEEVFTPRLRAWLSSIDIGSFALVCHPSLDGFESYEGGIIPEASGIQHTLEISSSSTSTNIESTSSSSIQSEGGQRSTLTCAPRRYIAKEHASLIAPAFASHYETQEDGSLLYKPSFRVFSGSGPLARLAMCCWKGKAKYNLMVQTVEAAALIQSLCSAGYSAE